jgi:hypothetical protein
MKKGKKVLLMLVVGVVVLSFSVIGYCHQPAKKETAELTFSGYLNVDLNYTQNDLNGVESESSDVYTSEMGIGVSAGLTEHVAGEALILYEETEDDALVVIDEAYLSMTCPKSEMWYMYLGKKYIPFADGESSFITDPFTHDLGETRHSIISLGAKVNIVDIEFGIFNGDSNNLSDPDDTIDDYYVALSAVPVESDELTVSITLAYLSDISDTGADLLGGVGYTDKVGGQSLCVSAAAKTGSITIEYVAAEDEMVDLGNLQPEALNVELTTSVISGIDLGLKYESTDEFTLLTAGGDPEITRFGLIVGHSLNEKASVSLEYISSEDDAASSNSVDTITAQLALEF